MIKTITIIASLLLAVAGLLGFLAPNFIGLSLSTGQSILYLFSGAAALIFVLLGPPAPSRRVCIFLGGLYALLGVAGLALGGPRLTIVPGQLVFETLDHLFHLTLGAVVLAAALSGRLAAPGMHPLRTNESGKAHWQKDASRTKETNDKNE